jgi:hypothetical protein
MHGDRRLLLDQTGLFSVTGRAERVDHIVFPPEAFLTGAICAKI